MDLRFAEFNISVDHLQQVCRVCLSESKNLIPINQVNLTHQLNERGSTEQIDLVSVLLKFSEIEVSTTDLKPKKICELCLEMSVRAFNFFQKFIWNNQLLDHKMKLIDYENGVRIKNIKLDHEYENISLADIDYPEFVNEDVKFDIIENTDTAVEDGNLPAIRRFELVPKKIVKIPRSKEEMDAAIKSLLPKKDPKKVKIKRKTPVEITNGGNEIFTCKFCGTSVTGFNEFIEHFTTQHPEKNKSCALCPYEVRRPTMKPFHIYHMAKKHSTKSIVCDFCSLYFKSQEDLDKHNSQIDHENKKCLLCDMDFSHKKKAVFGCILGHIARVHDLQEKNFLCSYCGKAFKYTINLRRHIQVLHEGKRVLCQHCGADFTTVHALNLHNEKLHGVPYVMQRKMGPGRRNELLHENRPASEAYLCPTRHCLSRFKSLHRLYAHADFHKLDQEYKCQICSEVYESFADLLQHQADNHETHTCSKCNEKFVLRSDLLYHNGLRGGSPICISKKYFRCQFCPKVVQNFVRFYFHSRLHPEFTDYLCPVCNRKFDSYGSYSKHYDGHKTYVCPHTECGKKFISKNTMKSHYCTHKHQSKIFSCNICNTIVVSAACLRQHIQSVHLNKRIFNCKTCGKSFKQKSHVMAHQTQHGLEKPWKCQICGIRFLFQSLLHNHLRVHTGQKPYQCMYCSKAFRDTTTRHKHIKKQHTEFQEEYLEYRRNKARRDNAVIEANSLQEIYQEEGMESQNPYSEDPDYEYKFVVPDELSDNGENVVYDDECYDVEGKPNVEVETFDHKLEYAYEGNGAGFGGYAN